MVYLSKIFIIFLSFSIYFFPIHLFSQVSSSDTLKITSWNLHLLPAPVFFRSKKKKRTEIIIDKFSKNLENDVLIFQEVFHKKRRAQLINGLSKNYPFYTKIVNESSGKLFKTNSGLIIFCKTAITEVKNIQFDNCSGSDCMAQKGAQMVSLSFNNNKVYIINTHLNSEPPKSIAINQMRMIKDSLAIFAYKNSPYVFIGGDFNINRSDSVFYQKMTKVFKTRNKYHFDISQNTSSLNKVKNTLDYIFLYNSIESKIKIKSYKYLIGPEWEKGRSRKVYGKTVGLSDHYPIQSVVVFDK